ncbi:MAG TPA: class I SAM-dependent methyltransferase [Candidatus Dormibacteraeota bacterium]|nr:class I SAM-dependent methyltransferase [Candidatus Dormibacteraeota bacterium]
MGDPDEYRSGVYRWWHLSDPSPELVDAVASGWVRPPGRVVDLGCGLGTEVAHLQATGFSCCGVDLSEVALRAARLRHSSVLFVRADARRLPFAAGTFDVALDRGTFQYFDEHERRRYSSEVRRVLRSGGRFLLRACTQSAGRPNGVSEDLVREAFEGWEFDGLAPAGIPSDTRSMPALIARLVRA